MDSTTVVLYRAGKRISIQEEDMTVEKICRIFQVGANSLYITDDANRAILPEAAGHFSTFNLSNHMHYEVHGEPEQSQPSVNRAPPPTAAVPSFSFRASSSASSSSAEIAASHGTPRAGGKFPAKSLYRSVHIGEIVNGKLSTSMTVAIRFSEAEANVEGITAKVQAALDSSESFTLTDSQGNEILDCEGSRNSKFWTSNSRKVYAIPDSDFVEFQNGRRAKASRRSLDSSSLEEVVGNIDHLKQAAKSLTDITSTINQLSELVKAKSAAAASASLHLIKDAFTCMVCRAVMKEPMFSTCCESLLGCRTCVEQWMSTSDLCLKCRTEEFGSMVHQVKGLSAVLYTVSAAFSEDG